MTIKQLINKIGPPVQHQMLAIIRSSIENGVEGKFVYNSYRLYYILFRLLYVNGRKLKVNKKKNDRNLSLYRKVIFITHIKLNNIFIHPYLRHVVVAFPSAQYLFHGLFEVNS